jgi:hypothetical protein
MRKVLGARHVVVHRTTRRCDEDLDRVAVAHVERSDLVDDLAVDPERLARGDEEGRFRRVVDRGLGERRKRSANTVEHDEAIAQLPEYRHRIALPAAARDDDPIGRRRRVLDPVEEHEDGAAIGADRSGESALSDARRPEQRHEPRVLFVEPSLDGCAIAGATDETGRRFHALTLPLSPTMRVRLDRYEAANRSMQGRTLVMFVLGGLGLVGGSFIAIMGLLMILLNEGDIVQNRAGVILGFFLGVVPCTVASILIGVGVKQRSKFRKLGELAAVGRQNPYFTSADVARNLGTTPQLAERLVVEAITMGLVEDAPAPYGQTPPITPAAAPHVVAMGHASTVTPAVTPVGGGATLESAPQPIEPGAILANTYRIEEPLGVGGMGAVFAARHLRTGRRYAVKTILRGERAGEGDIRRFEREATAASALGHPNIVQVHDFNVAAGGTFYLVMDLLEGETLADRLKHGPLAWPEAQRIAVELGSALAAAHEHGLLHRDIKPSNVFLAKSKGAPERSVLVDFGLVKPLAESNKLTSTGAVVGTPVYMSPEQARGETLDVRSDLYSLAAVVFEMLTGAPPFADKTMAALYARLLNEPAPRASQVARRPIPRAVDDVLSRALAKDKTARHVDVRSFRDALAAIAEDAPSTERMVN